jgi:KDO2-lipid IV(A) lauroyltransferase
MRKLWAIRLAAPLVGRLPWLFYPVAAVAGWLAWWAQPGARARVVRNMLPPCDGDPGRARRAGLQAFQNVARYWVDLASLPYRDMATFDRDHLRIIDHGGGIAALERPGPIVVVSAHMGNGELAIQAMNTRGRPFVALVEALQPPALSRKLVQMRSSGGGHFYAADFGGVRHCLEALKRGEVVGMMGDRDIQQTGLAVTLCGREVKLPRGPWELARRTEATVMPVFSTRSWTDRFTVHMEQPYHVACTDDPEADIREAMVRWVAVFEGHLRATPGQWAVLEDFWRVHANA